VVRSVTWQEPDHQRIEIFTGFPKRERRPSFGSYVSRLAQRRDTALPKFVSLKGDDQEIAEAEQPLWVGAQHRAFVPDSKGLKTLELTRRVDLSRLKSRKELLTELDTLRREVDATGEMRAFDALSNPLPEFPLNCICAPTKYSSDNAIIRRHWVSLVAHR